MDLSPEYVPDPRWSTAVPDWEDRIMAGKSLLPELPLFDAVAEKALRIFKRLRIPDIHGMPTFGEVCEDWVFDLVRVIFGSYDPNTKVRIISEFFLLVPKKNGKSAIAAGIILTAAIMNERPSVELILISASQKIAGISFTQIKGMIGLDEKLRALFHIQTHLKLITHHETKAVIMILSADGDIVTGSKAAYVLIDEVHVLLSKPRAPEIMVELRGGLDSRPEGFVLQITTQSKKIPVGQFKAELDQARAVRDGEMQLPMLAVLYELPEALTKKEGWRDEATWPLVNPNMGLSTTMQKLRDKLKMAERSGPDAVALFASQHLNVQVGKGLVQDRWVGAQLWTRPKAVYRGLTFEAFLDLCEVVVAGIDGGGMDDLLGMSFVGRLPGSRGWLSWSRAWAHPIALKRRESIVPELREFEEDGDLVICEYETQDLDDVVELLLAARDAGKLPDKGAIGMDPEGVAALVDAAIAAGLTLDQIVAVSQGYRLNGPIKGTERKLFDGSFRHADQPIMDWCVSNAKTETRGNAVVVTKAVSGTGKIDPLMALFNAVFLMSLNPEAQAPGLEGMLARPVMVA